MRKMINIAKTVKRSAANVSLLWHTIKTREHTKPASKLKTLNRTLLIFTKLLILTLHHVEPNTKYHHCYFPIVLHSVLSLIFECVFIDVEMRDIKDSRSDVINDKSARTCAECY